MVYQGKAADRSTGSASCEFRRPMTPFSSNWSPKTTRGQDAARSVPEAVGLAEVVTREARVADATGWIRDFSRIGVRLGS